MFPTKLRFALIIVCVLVGIYSFIEGQLFPGVALFVVAGLLAYGHFSYNRIWLIYKHVLSAEFDKAEAQLKKVGSVAGLSKEQQSYYHFSKGMVAMHKTAYEEAETAFLQALEIGLKTDNDIVVANFYLAQIFYNQTSYAVAREYLNKAQQYPIHPNLQTHVNQLELMLNQERSRQN